MRDKLFNFFVLGAGKTVAAKGRRVLTSLRELVGRFAEWPANVKAATAQAPWPLFLDGTPGNAEPEHSLTARDFVGVARRQQFQKLRQRGALAPVSDALQVERTVNGQILQGNDSQIARLQFQVNHQA